MGLVEIVKSVGDFFTGSNKPFDPSKRAFLKAATLTAGAAIIGTSGLGCLKKEDILLGEPIYRETDGNPISQNAIDWFNVSATSDPGVFSLEEELLEVFNKTHEYVFGESVNSKIGLKFSDSDLEEGHDGKFLIEYISNGIKVKEAKIIKLRPGIGRYRAFSMLSHERAHEFGGEAIAQLADAMMGLGTLITTGLGEAQNYKIVKASTNSLFHIFNKYLNCNSEGLNPFSAPFEEHQMGSIAALLALNRFDGDSELAYNHLKRNEGFYYFMTEEFINSCFGKPDVEGVTQHFKPYSNAPVTISVEKKPYYQVAFVELLNVVRRQLTKTTLIKLNKSNLEDDLMGELTNPAQTYFKPGFKHSMIYRPDYYQDPILE